MCCECCVDPSVALLACLLCFLQSIKAKFDAFDEEATGTITYPEFVSMASQAFANASEPPHPLSGTRPGKCMRHGSTTVFASDGFCVTCEMDALEHQDELLPTGTGGGGGGAAGERGGAATPDASWLKAWAVRKPKRLTDKVRGPAVSLLRKAAGEAAQPAKKKISRGTHAALHTRRLLPLPLPAHACSSKQPRCSPRLQRP